MTDKVDCIQPLKYCYENNKRQEIINDSLLQVTTTDDKILKDNYQIRDRYNFVCAGFYFLGICSVLPLYYFSTADNYWNYKLRDTSLNSTNQTVKTVLQSEFPFYLNIAGQAPNLIFLVLNAFLCKWISSKTRIIVSQFMTLVSFIVITLFVKIVTDDWQDEFFKITLVLAAITNAFNAIFYGAAVGIIVQFPSKYITAFSGGSSIAGILTATNQIFALWIGTNPLTTGLMYFTIGDIVIFGTLVVYILMERQEFFKYHVKKKSRCKEELSLTQSDKNSAHVHKVSHMKLFKTIWPYGLSICLVLAETYSIFPSITVQVASEGKNSGHEWNTRYFSPIASCLAFSCSEYVGTQLSQYFGWPKDKPWLVIPLTLLRMIFIPLVLVCNVQPRPWPDLPVYITSDCLFILLMILFGIGSGYLYNRVFALIPLLVERDDQEAAAAMMGAFVGLGVTVGSSTNIIFL